MPIEWFTEKLNIQQYYKIIRRIVIFNADKFEGADNHMSGYQYWEQFKNNWKVKVIPVEKAKEYERFYGHLNIEASDGITWGITGYKEMFLFVHDSRDPRKVMESAMTTGHELLHAIYIDNIGTYHVTRKYDAPDGKARTKAPASTVIVHDNWYGTKITQRFWVLNGVVYIPITYPYIPIWRAKEQYAI